MALKQLNNPANLGEILENIKKNRWYEFNCPSGRERSILSKSIERNKRIIKNELGDYTLVKPLKKIEMEELKMQKNKILNRIFISHYSKDANYVKRIINALEKMGIKSKQIRCSSYEGYGVPADGDIFDWIKENLKSEDTFVLFVMSEEYFTRPVCLCEMGACIINSKKYIPILIPPLTFENMKKGMIPGSKKAYMINDIKGLTGIKETLEQNFGLEPIPTTIWNDFLEDYSMLIQNLIEQDNKEKRKKYQENKNNYQYNHL
ncbi:toll/interleukin-1 receptor domain-containing protein [Bacillus cereus]|uniref:toll/interleukin-1 receptor domain-containing protein n=1 Tax=Bacillus cereus TaxID=1396 RepID=UPI0021D65C91|nr:toll/interleukin-1 receptor domain-containing protein [Bacillus cereus]MCU7757202.1 toll/interleukin-1 receptor domain-containing protein [Bacillus cereus]MDC7753025.1 toll/interleukin-1 receptor domain-containing protein [Bacillus cereus]